MSTVSRDAASGVDDGTTSRGSRGARDVKMGGGLVEQLVSANHDAGRGS